MLVPSSRKGSRPDRPGPRRLAFWGFTFLGFTFLGLALLWLTLALTPPPPLLQDMHFSVQILDRHGALLRLGLSPDEKYRVYTPLAHIAPEAVQASLLYEDRYFYQHFGLNPLALVRSALSMLQGSRRMGGSTITMQVARLRYGLSTSSLWGKIVQSFHALRLEYHYSKEEILEAYFNLAPYGSNVEGIGAAAQIYFHHSAARLTLSESLALASVPQNPGKRSPLKGTDFATARARLHRLWAQHKNPAGLKEGAATPDSRRLPALRVWGPAALPFAAPHVSAELLTTAHSGPTSGPHAEPALAGLSGEPALAGETGLAGFSGVTGGGPVHTTLDRSLQDLMEGGLARFAARGRAFGLHNAAALLVHWPSMEIRALVGSADFHNKSIFGQVDGTRARRSPGSTLKPFIYALALDQGLIHPQTLLLDSPHSFGSYSPENFDRDFRGPLPAQEALRASRNIPAIGLAARLRPDLYTFLQNAAVSLPASSAHYGLSLVLGGAEVSMRELAQLYAMLPNKGLWQGLRLIKNTRDEGARAARSLLSPEAALITLRMLEDPRHSLHTPQGILPLRYKTGTSNRFRDAWTAGLVGPYVLVVWVGNFDNSSNPLLVGGQVAAPLFTDLAQALSQREALPDLIPQQQEGLNIVRLPVCTATGDTDTRLCKEQTTSWYIPGLSPTRSSGVFRTILVDKATGLRSCRAAQQQGESGAEEGQTEEIVWEFWPTDIQEIFAEAGIVKAPPPPFLPQCRPHPAASLQEAADAESRGIAGHAPRILSPKEGVNYQRRVAQAGGEGPGGSILLRATVDADAQAVFWFVDSLFVGRTTPLVPLLWRPTNGVHTVRAVDDLGRAALRRILVETLP